MTLSELQELDLRLELKISDGYLKVILTGRDGWGRQAPFASDSISLSELRDELRMDEYT